MNQSKRILLTGATGYIGGRLVPELLERGHDVRCLVRTPEKVQGNKWASQVELVKGDLGDEESLGKALSEIDVAYYLVHSMADPTKAGFAKRDLQLARSFAELAEENGVKQIIYLGGLGNDKDPNLSTHLKSRHDVGDVLRSANVPVIELRAAVIIGSGSASFEMLRNVAEVLPAMITPKWVQTKCQPIAIRDVLHYLCTALDLDGTNTIEIGCPDVLTYQQMMETYAKVIGLRKRLIVRVPLLTPKLSSHWIGLVTPLPTSVAKPLVHGLANEVVVRDQLAEQLMPHQCLSFEEAIKLAIKRTRDLEVTTSWANAEIEGRSPADPMPADPEWSGGTVLIDSQTVETTVEPNQLFKTICGIGGSRGWFVTDYLWRTRGLIDKLVGGVGMRRGRRHPDELRIGDPVDFWRVEALSPNSLLRLRAEMKLPGRAWLEWTISVVNGQSSLTQRALYQPRGLLGRVYWYALVPFHWIIFKGLAKSIVKRSETTTA